MSTSHPFGATTALRASLFGLAALSATALVAEQSPAAVVTLVNDTWQDSSRAEPASPTYSEFGIDSDLDGDLESAWFRGAGTGATSSVTPGHMVHAAPPAVPPATAGGSISLTTYFTPDATPVTLNATGDKLTVRWTFTPSGVNSTVTGNQDFRLAIVDSPNAARVSTDASPPSAAYTGYGVYANFRSGNLGNANSFRLMERVAGANNLLSTAGAFTQVANGADTTTPGYASGVSYAFTMEFLRTALGLDITATMAGAGLGGSANQIQVAFSDTTPNTYTFDTFAFRPQTPESTATSYDTTNFRVDTDIAPIIPEPAAVAAAAITLLALKRRR